MIAKKQGISFPSSQGKEMPFYVRLQPLQNRLYPRIRHATARSTIRNDLGKIRVQTIPAPMQKNIRPHKRFMPFSLKRKAMLHHMRPRLFSRTVLLIFIPGILRIRGGNVLRLLHGVCRYILSGHKPVYKIRNHIQHFRYSILVFDIHQLCRPVLKD